MLSWNGLERMSENSYKSKTLDDVRRRIDELDNRIHDTLMERAQLISKIVEEKKKNNIAIVQPAREAKMIRRLLKRHQGILPHMAVVRIWRELVGAVSLRQTGLNAFVTAPEGVHEYWDLARDYFGSCLPMKAVKDPLLAIAAVREGEATFGVVPWPQDEANPWWTYLLNHNESKGPMHIAIRLPHGDEPGQEDPEHRALVVSQSGFNESGEDRSFLLLECPSHISRGKIVDSANKKNMTVRSIYSKRCADPESLNVHIIEVEGYWMDAEDNLLQFVSQICGEEGVGLSRCLCIGGYPVPPKYEKFVVPHDHSSGSQ